MRSFYLVSIAGLLLLTACNDAKKPSDGNFTKAINQYLAKHGEACTVIGRQFPADVPEAEQQAQYGIGPELAALEQAGLVQGSNRTAVVHGLLDPLRGSTPPQAVKHYELTSEGKKYFQQVPGTFGTSSGFCYGRKTVDSIVKWTEPMAMGAYSQTEVTYTYKIVDPASWAERPDVQRVFSDIQTTVTGASKTTTLRMLSASTTKRGLYLAFNRNIADDARQKFPTHVTCATAHSLAYRAVRRTLAYPDWKLKGALTPNMIVGTFRMPDSLTFRCGLALPKWSYCALLLDALKRFLQSEDELPAPAHIPRYGCLETLAEEHFKDFCSQAIEHVAAIWQAVQHPKHELPLGHDGYLKLWSLSKPNAQVDYILVDEAQDLNPVLLAILRRVACPVIYVGDPYQQIYEWRGAAQSMPWARFRRAIRPS
ncbi:MAG: helicase, superfamily [Acidobacteriaceae bacterium]|nr:helicase, superfamily [Acidobacteriaceae bacterium]